MEVVSTRSHHTRLEQLYQRRLHLFVDSGRRGYRGGDSLHSVRPDVEFRLVLESVVADRALFLLFRLRHFGDGDDVAVVAGNATVGDEEGRAELGLQVADASLS